MFDVRERVSHTAIPLGSACVLLSAIQDTSRLRIQLLSRSQTTIGFLTVSAWALEAEDRGSSTEHTPCRAPSNSIQVKHKLYDYEIYIYRMFIAHNLRLNID